MTACRLVVLRGLSAAGKSTVASELARTCADKVAVLEEDYFRRVVLRRQDKDRVACRRVQCACAVAALDSGFHVILDGILNARYYRAVIAELLARSPDTSSLYYFDVSLEETLRRHASKPIASDVPVSSLRDWYAAASPLGHVAETLIPEVFSVEQAVQLVQQTSRSAGAARPVGQGAGQPWSQIRCVMALMKTVPTSAGLLIW
jgi:predicted kinase